MIHVKNSKFKNQNAKFRHPDEVGMILKFYIVILHFDICILHLFHSTLFSQNKKDPKVVIDLIEMNCDFWVFVAFKKAVFLRSFLTVLLNVL